MTSLAIIVNFRSRLMAAYGTFLVLMVAGISGLVGFLALREVQGSASERIQDIGTQFVRLLDHQFWERQGELDQLSSTALWLDPPWRQAARQSLSRLQTDVSPTFSWLAVVDRTGTIVAANHTVLEGLSLAGSRLRQRLLCEPGHSDENAELPLHPWFPQRFQGEMLQFVYVSRPLITPHGECKGAVVALMGWEWARQIQALLLAPLASEEGKELFVLSSNGQVLLGPAATQQKPDHFDFLPIADLQPGDSRVLVQRWPDGSNYLTSLHRSSGYGDIPGLNWLVVARQPLAIAYAPAHALAFRVFLVVTSLGGLGLALSWRLAGWLSEPVKQLSRMGQALNPNPALERNENEFRLIDQAIRQLHLDSQHHRLACSIAEHRANHDPLTGLVNRRGLEEFLLDRQELFRTSQTDATAMVVLVLDLDHFKAVNDSLGHAAGDDLLRAIGERLRRLLRPEDLAVRQGGDEFLVLMPSCAPQALQLGHQVAKRLLEELNNPVPLGNGRTVRVGVSVGMACWPLDSDRIEGAIQIADQRLFRAKQSGRGCLAC